MTQPEAMLDVIVVPRAATTRLELLADGSLRIHVTRPPAGGEANRAVIEAIAARLRVPRGAVELVSGARGRRKRILVRGLDADRLRERLGQG